MAQPADDEEFRSQWFTYPVEDFLRDADPGGPPVSIELRTASAPAVIEVSGGTVRTRIGAAASPDLVLAGRPQMILALLTGKLTAVEVAARGLEITGDKNVLRRVLPDPAHGLPRQPELTKS
jgi:putative sterol carrier protein